MTQGKGSAGNPSGERSGGLTRKRFVNWLLGTKRLPLADRLEAGLPQARRSDSTRPSISARVRFSVTADEVAPKILGELLEGDAAKSQRVMTALLQMKKLDKELTKNANNP